MSKTLFVIKVPKAKNRNPLIATGQGKSQVMGDRRTKRSKDAKNSWQKEWE